jgi:hypothetical protein
MDHDAEEEDVDSDTDTIRPAAQARKASSIRSLRSLFTPRIGDQPSRSGHWPISGIRDEEEPLAISGPLSSSPPQMNGFGADMDGIERRLTEADEDRTPVMSSQKLEPLDERNDAMPIGQDGGQSLLLQPKISTGGQHAPCESTGVKQNLRAS